MDREPEWQGEELQALIDSQDWDDRHQWNLERSELYVRECELGEDCPGLGRHHHDVDPDEYEPVTQLLMAEIASVFLGHTVTASDLFGLVGVRDQWNAEHVAYNPRPLAGSTGPVPCPVCGGRRWRRRGGQYGTCLVCLRDARGESGPFPNREVREEGEGNGKLRGGMDGKRGKQKR